MANSARTKNPRDVTGRKAQLAAEALADELKARAAEISTVTVAGDFEPEPAPDAPVVSVGGVHVETPMKRLRVNADIEDMTFGIGTNYNFERGQVYSVPTPLYDHLERLGFVWH